MIYAQILTVMLSAISPIHAAPFLHAALETEPYNCGYVRTRLNSSVVAGISAFGACTPFFFNKTINDYQDAFAYTLYGGCQCQFYRYFESTQHHSELHVN
jgi:hypothetical protein